MNSGQWCNGWMKNNVVWIESVDGRCIMEHSGTLVGGKVQRFPFIVRMDWHRSYVNL